MQQFPFQKLLEWHEKNGRHDLAWREYNFDEKQIGYRVWLAEIMLQQTQVERVKIYFENILRAFPTVENLAHASYEEFFPYYKGLGYYSRARNMLKAAKKVVDDFDGIFPSETEDLKKLPGVGPYTAQAIRAFAYDIPTLSFDTNLEKIFSRFYHGNKFQKLTKPEKEELLEQMREFCKTSPFSVIPANAGISQDSTLSGILSLNQGKETTNISRNINNALMDYGATISMNNISGIDWENYPFPESKFYQTRGSLEPQKEKKKSSFPSKKAFVICILHENHKKYLSDSVIPENTCISKQQSNKKSGAKIDPATSAGGHNSFAPFLIGKNTGNPRAMIQEFFLQKYNLELSVRPPEIKSYLTDEVPYMICYAQIQSGTHNFNVFENLKVRGFEEGLVEGMEF